jgi:hypothetical protein
VQEPTTFGSRIQQLDAPIKYSRECVEEEEVTVRDPRHALYGRRFRVARRPAGTIREGRFILVFYRDGVLLRIPECATRRPVVDATATKLNIEAIRALVETAQASAPGLVGQMEHSGR